MLLPVMLMVCALIPAPTLGRAMRDIAQNIICPLTIKPISVSGAKKPKIM